MLQGSDPGEISMKRFAFILLTFFLFAWATSSLPPTPLCPDCPSLTVYFSPQGGATEAIVKELDKAQKFILVQAYFFTSAAITLGTTGWGSLNPAKTPIPN
jgi:hypothetical protein